MANTKGSDASDNAAAGSEASADDKQAKQPAFKKIRVSTTKPNGMYRGGQHFTQEVKEVNVSDLSPQQLEQILADKTLKVEKV